MAFWYSAAGYLANTLLSFVPHLTGKAGKWQRGQAEAWAMLGAFRQRHTEAPFWFHCASLGEFEQAKPVLLALKAQYPDVPVVVSFFSPSGYEARKDFAGADLVCYLPLDGGDAPRYWITALKPRAVFWVKYEFWLGYLKEIKRSGIPLFLLAALPKEKYFAGWRAGYYREAFATFDRIFLQYAEGLPVLPDALRAKVVVSGDPRFDNVLAGVAAAKPVAELDAFKKAGNRPVLLVGSAWQADMEVLLPALASLGNPYRLVVFPHEMHGGFLSFLKEKLPGKVGVWSQGAEASANALIVDQVGFLARAYAYADVAWVGGGFGSGLHNILEAAAWGKPVVHGPLTRHFPEAEKLAQAGGGFAVADSESAEKILKQMLEVSARTKAGDAAARFIASHAGATERIMRQIVAVIG